MVKVLFVCLGNICRSPMAEAIFRNLVKREGLEKQIFVDSAGTGDWHIGQTPHKGTIDILSKNQISTEGLKARQIDTVDLEEFDYIIAMDADNKRNIEMLRAKAPKAKIDMLLNFAPHIPEKNVPDPYYTGNFDVVYDLVTEGCERVLAYIKEHDLQ